MADQTKSDHEYDNDGRLDLAGSSNAYTATTARAITGYFKGLRVCGKANHSNDGASTLNINGLGAIAIRKGATTALTGGEIVSDKYYDFIYDDANSVFQLDGAIGTAVEAATVLAENAILAGSNGSRGIKTYTGNETAPNLDLDDIVDTSIYGADSSTSNRPGGVGNWLVLTMRRTDTISSQTAFSRATAGLIYHRINNSGVWSSWVQLLSFSDVIDEDNMASDSAVRVPTQQSVKAYVDTSQVVTADASGSVSSAATLDIALGSADMYEIDLINFAPATDGASLFARFSQSGSFLAGASDYRWSRQTGGLVLTDGADSEIEITADVGNGSNETCGATIRIFRPSVGSFRKILTYNGYKVNVSNTFEDINGAGELIANANAVDGFRLLFSSGNIASGFYAVRRYSFT